jgi:hypothetical protein
MYLITNENTGTRHVMKDAGITLCGIYIQDYTVPLPIYNKKFIEDEEVMCRKCHHIILSNQNVRKDLGLPAKICKHEKCVYHMKGAASYCCNACYSDVVDSRRLKQEEDEMDSLREKMLEELDEMIKSHKTNRPVKLEKKALKLLKYFVKEHASVYKTTNLSTILTEVIENYDGYLKESLF